VVVLSEIRESGVGKTASAWQCSVSQKSNPGLVNNNFICVLNRPLMELWCPTFGLGKSRLLIICNGIAFLNCFAKYRAQYKEINNNARNDTERGK